MKIVRVLAFAMTILLFFSFLPEIQAQSATSETRFRWDIVTVTPTPSGATVDPGGEDTSTAADGSAITMSGTGSFDTRNPGNVTGGGDWRRTDSTGSVVASGKYTVTRLLRFDPAPGTLPLFIVDNAGANANARSGLAYLEIRYTGGSHGVLVVSCHLPEGTPSSIVEGITASQDFTYFFRVTSGNTLFHVSR